MKLGAITKLDKENTATSKNKTKQQQQKIDDDIMSTNCGVTAFFNLWPICSHPETKF